MKKQPIKPNPPIPPVLFVGAGPGDPDLITVKGQKALAAADLVIYTGSLVPEALLQWTSPGAESQSSAGMHLEEIVNRMETACRAGKRVVRLHTGDPSLYGAIFEQMAQLKRRGIACQVIPGVTAAFSAAAAMGIEYTLPEITQTLILTRMAGRTPVPETESLASLAGHRASMAVYLSMAMVEEVADILMKSYGLDAACAVVYRASQPEEQIIRTDLQSLAEVVKKENITREALIIVSPVLAVDADGMDRSSKLYDRGFSHGYRKADTPR